jgi:SAM-dependent methyltransferase
MSTANLNLQPNYWNTIWDAEGADTWRTYPGCFGRIAWAVGHFNDVLDMGCGAGVLARKLHEFGNVVTGLDISEVAVAQLPPEIRGLVAILPNIPVADASFDVAVATELLEHIDDDEACVKEIVRILRPGGRAYFAVPNDCLGPEEIPEHVRKYTPETLYTLLSSYGSVFMETFVDEFSVDSEQGLALPTILAALCVETGA